MLRGDVLKDDSGASAVFTEQGSSASQVIAATVMDVIAKLPGCTYWTSRRRSISLRPCEKWRTLQGCFKFKSHNVQTYGYVFYDTHGQNLVQPSNTQWFLSNETCMDTHLPASCGNDNMRKFHWDLYWKNTELGMSWMTS